MNQLAKRLGLGMASVALISATPSTTELSAEAMRLLDPAALLAGACGQGRTAGANLRQRLQFAMTYAQEVDATVSRPVELVDGLGDMGFTVSSADPQARRFFNQGLAYSYGFNHAEAIRAFREAQRRDPGCATCWWGEALAHGPNINAPMDPAVIGQAVKAAGRAMSLRAQVSPREQALIEAMATRYSADPQADRAALDQAYAEAMVAVAKRFPEDDNIAVLTAEALMDTQPWDYWEADLQTPKGRMGEAIALVETVLARNPDHPQAIHLYIHLLEASALAKKAEPYADRLAKPLMPSAGHLVHMPAHLYYRVGRFKDSIRVNVEAARADEAFLAKSDDAGIYRFGYYPHNVHFIVTSSQMAGDMRTAIDQAQKLQRILNVEVSAAQPWIQPVNAAPYFAYVQFAAPEAILALDRPDERLPYVAGMWHYARAAAHAQQRDTQGVERELAALRQIVETVDFTGMVDQGVPAPDLLRLAEQVARGRLAYAQGQYAEAAAHYRSAMVIEDGIAYMEPPFWYYPVRQSLGAALYRAGDLPGARQAFMETLARSPNNGWALFGLMETQRAMGDRAGARASQAALDRAWAGDPRWLRLDRL